MAANPGGFDGVGTAFDADADPRPSSSSPGSPFASRSSTTPTNNGSLSLTHLAGSAPPSGALVSGTAASLMNGVATVPLGSSSSSSSFPPSSSSAVTGVASSAVPIAAIVGSTLGCLLLVSFVVALLVMSRRNKMRRRGFHRRSHTRTRSLGAELGLVYKDGKPRRSRLERIKSLMSIMEENEEDEEDIAASMVNLRMNSTQSPSRLPSHLFLAPQLAAQSAPTSGGSNVWWPFSTSGNGLNASHSPSLSPSRTPSPRARSPMTGSKSPSMLSRIGLDLGPPAPPPLSYNFKFPRNSTASVIEAQMDYKVDVDMTLSKSALRVMNRTSVDSTC